MLSVCLLSRKVAVEIVRNFARIENSAVPIGLKTPRRVCQLTGGSG